MNEENKMTEKVRAFFPELPMKKTWRNLWRQPKQPPVIITINGLNTVIPRGRVVVIKKIVQEALEAVCIHEYENGVLVNKRFPDRYECFVSNRKVED